MVVRSPAKTPPRLPGVRFEVQAPPLVDVLPRMDVAALAGFAASGPLHTPVAVEDAAQFARIFGEDAPLAWDQTLGGTIYANLAPAVRAFFRNGGERCWVVRVAGSGAASNRFPLPGLACLTGSPAQPITQALALARSEGSWSDGLEASTAVLSEPVPLAPVSLADLTFEVSPGPGTPDIQAGDLLRLTFAGSGDLLHFLVQSVTPAQPGKAQRLAGVTPAWFKAVASADDGQTPTAAWDLSSGSPVSLPLCGTALGVASDLSLQIELNLPLAEAPLPGALLRVDVGTLQAYLTVQTVNASQPSADATAAVQVSGPGLWWSGTVPVPLPAEQPLAEILTFELWVASGDQYPLRLSDLGLAQGHPRFWGDLPLDETLYDANPLVPRAVPPALWAEAAGLSGSSSPTGGAATRFPLAGPDAGSASPLFFFPLGMGALPEAYLGPLAGPGTPLERDGLAAFSAELFLDPDLVGASAGDLLNEADYLRYQSPVPRRLKGIHAFLGIEEATLAAAPDAVQRGWTLSAPPAELGGLTFPPLPHPEWWRFQACDPRPAPPQADRPPREHFLACDLLILPAPELDAVEPDSIGSFRLTWTVDPDVQLPEKSVFVLEEATTTSFADAEELYRGTETSQSLYSRSPGEYYYRVRVELGEITGNWSNGVGVRVALADRWVVLAEVDYQVEPLLAVQRSLLRLCAARGDLFAALALPEHYREDQAIAHASRLKSFQDVPIPVGPAFSLPLSIAEAPAMSYGAVYHPWLVGLEESQAPAGQPAGAAAQPYRRMPPEGAALGVLAQRSLGRGAWVAAANEPLDGIVALTPAISRQRWLDLQEAQVNLFRQEPDGFMTLNSDTLSDDPDLAEINVRRLLSLLRRLALREGAAYVFEPNDTVFQRMVQRGFESWLTLMFGRGAFSGRTAAESFQVNVISTPQDIDAGRFIVELRVAPSLPLKFLTIRLVQTGVHGLVQEGRS